MNKKTKTKKQKPKAEEFCTCGEKMFDAHIAHLTKMQKKFGDSGQMEYIAIRILAEYFKDTLNKQGFSKLMKEISQ